MAQEAWLEDAAKQAEQGAREAGDDGLRDGFGRRLRYLRISVTDRCNLRCRYCMPAEGVTAKSHRDILSFEEILRIARTAVGLGVCKIRLTGGEPLVRRGIAELCRMLSTLKAEGLEELCLTSNGILLPELAADLKAAGLDRLNLSVDSLREERYRAITRGGELKDFRAGLEAAEAAGFRNTKLNVVLIPGFNEDEIADFAHLTRERELDVRFIELMPLGEGLKAADGFVPQQKILDTLPMLLDLGQEGVAHYYRLPDAAGRIGLISPMSAHFCPSCDRLRLTADGKLKPCLHSRREWNLKGLDEAGIARVLAEASALKPYEHHLTEEKKSRSTRNMNEIGG